MKSALIIAAIVIVSVIGGAVYVMTKGDNIDRLRANMREGAVAECTRTTRAALPTATTSDAQVTQYCTCTSDRLFASLSDTEIRQLAEAERTGSTEMVDTIIARSTPILEACHAEAGLPGTNG